MTDAGTKVARFDAAIGGPGFNPASHDDVRADLDRLVDGAMAVLADRRNHRLPTN